MPLYNSQQFKLIDISIKQWRRFYRDKVVVFCDTLAYIEESEHKMITTVDLSQMEVRDSYTRLLSHLPGAVYRCEVLLENNTFNVNYKTNLKFASQGICKLLNISPPDLEYNTAMFDEMTFKEDQVKSCKKVYDSFINKTQYQLMYRVNLCDGTIKWIWDQGEVVHDKSSGQFFLEGLMMDFSEYKIYELALKEENKRLQKSLQKIYGFGDIVGTSEPMQKLYTQIQKAAETSSNVLILGETGSGKELVAKTIHDLSNQKGKFIAVNCGAIPAQLMESEFFGYIKGAFSGAVSNREGFISAAHNGTLFLDEIGELPISLQVKLLRTLENKQFIPVGGNTPEQSTFRLVTATHQDLPKMVKNKEMRPDFYYRINVLPISVPSLKERSGDIPLLMNAYIAQNNIRESMPLHVRMAMERHSWPGNVRELRNFLERFFIFGEVTLEDFTTQQDLDFSTLEEDMPLDKAMDIFESKLLIRAMEKCHWKQTSTATLLKLNLRTLQRKLKYHNITR